jgi:hypothetical protein
MARGSGVTNSGNTNTDEEILTASGDDPAGLTDGDEDEKNVGPGGTIGGVENVKGEDTPPKAGKKKSVGKSADFWRNVVAKSLGGMDVEAALGLEESTNSAGKEFGTGSENSATLSKAFSPQLQQPQFPPQQPQPPQPQMGMQQPGGYPVAQTVGAQPFGMGQPTAPPMAQQQPAPQLAQLPPEVVQYIQQLEQMVGQQQGNGDDMQSNDPRH